MDTTKLMEPTDQRELTLQMTNSVSVLAENLDRIRTNDTNYYDSAKDKVQIRQYYQGIDTSVDGKELFRLLNRLLESTHQKQLIYGSGRRQNESGYHLKTWVDLHKDGTFRSLYSGKQADPIKVIEQGFIGIQQADIRDINGDDINIEHVVPQSWFGRKEPMRGDLHHLFYCEEDCNSFRGNKNYEDFPDYKPELFALEQIRDECGMANGQGGGEFEPEYGKGLVARATLYFLVRYPDKILSEYKNEVKNIPVLLKWHKEFPPNLIYEKHRNQAIYEVQGNRNPFIDFPDWAERVDFSRFLH